MGNEPYLLPYAQVCPRCVLRTLGHSVYDDYCLAVPSVPELEAYLMYQLQLVEGGKPDSSLNAPLHILPCSAPQG